MLAYGLDPWELFGPLFPSFQSLGSEMGPTFTMFSAFFGSRVSFGPFSLTGSFLATAT